MSHLHDHDHDHGHSHAPADYTWAFAIGVLLNIGFVVAEVIYGILADSMALIADAGHNLSDVLGLLLAWGASYLGTKEPTLKRTYGLKSTSIMAALLNAIILLVAIGGIITESVRRFLDPAPVAGMTVIIVAAVGVVINTATALLFMSGRKGDLNIRGAFLHMAADAAVSLGVVIAGIGILFTRQLWIDPVVSLLIAVVILVGTWGLLRESANLALHAVPSHIDVRDVQEHLIRVQGIEAVHDLHIWGMSTTETALTAHLIRENTGRGNDDELISRITRDLQRAYGIDHVTLQLESRFVSMECGATCQPAGGGCDAGSRRD
jgi:cobalt-zinc-cadmium efflux system protein